MVVFPPAFFGKSQLGVGEKAIYDLLNDDSWWLVSNCHRAPQNQPPLSAPKPATVFGI